MKSSLLPSLQIFIFLGTMYPSNSSTPLLWPACFMYCKAFKVSQYSSTLWGFYPWRMNTIFWFLCLSVPLCMDIRVASTRAVARIAVVNSYKRACSGSSFCSCRQGPRNGIGESFGNLMFFWGTAILFSTMDTHFPSHIFICILVSVPTHLINICHTCAFLFWVMTAILIDTKQHFSVEVF